MYNVSITEATEAFVSFVDVRNMRAGLQQIEKLSDVAAVCKAVVCFYCNCHHFAPVVVCQFADSYLRD